MKNRIMPFRIFLLILTALSVSIQACKKDRKPSIDPDEQPPAGGTRTELTLDSIFLYAKQIYLWNNQLPSYKEFNPRKYTSFEDELYAITQKAKNPKTNQPYEYTGRNYPKYSYIEEENGIQGSLSSVNLEGEGFDFGFDIGAADSKDIRIIYVEPGSPADEAQLVRGNRIITINGTTIDVNTSPDFLEDAFLQAEMDLTVQRAGGKTTAVKLIKSFYTSNPVVKTAILNAGAKKVGYMAYLRFSDSLNSAGYLKKAFTEFAAAGNISDLIIDLRYNGGGYVKTAEYLANLIAPASLNGKVMYIEHYNDLMRNGKASILKNQILTDSEGQPKKTNGRTATYADINFTEKANTFYFKSEGVVQSIKNVYFIITGHTASASELLINSLRPYLNVTLAGSRSYGKPVGFFPVKIDKYNVFMSNFQSRNADNFGDYFDGFLPDIPAGDDIRYDFGDPAEASLAAALNAIGGAGIASAKTSAAASEVKMQSLWKGKRFNGMIEDRFTLKD